MTLQLISQAAKRIKTLQLHEAVVQVVLKRNILYPLPPPPHPRPPHTHTDTHARAMHYCIHGMIETHSPSPSPPPLINAIPVHLLRPVQSRDCVCLNAQNKMTNKAEKQCCFTERQQHFYFIFPSILYCL